MGRRHVVLAPSARRSDTEVCRLASVVRPEVLNRPELLLVLIDYFVANEPLQVPAEPLPSRACGVTSLLPGQRRFAACLVVVLLQVGFDLFEVLILRAVFGVALIPSAIRALVFVVGFSF